MNKKLRKLRACWVLPALALCSNVSAVTIGEVPVVQVIADDKVFDITVRQSEKGWVFDQSIQDPEFNIQVSGALNPDPSIAYGLAIQDLGAPSIFGFFFFTPIVPTGPGTTVNASVVGGLTDFTGNGVSVTPTGATVQTSDLYFAATTMGVDVGAAAAFGPGPAGAFYAYGPFAAGPIGGPVGPWTGMGVAANFGLSGSEDILAMTGFAQVVTAVPEGGVSLAGMATLIGLLVSGARRGLRRSA